MNREKKNIIISKAFKDIIHFPVAYRPPITDRPKSILLNGSIIYLYLKEAIFFKKKEKGGLYEENKGILKTEICKIYSE